MPMNAGKLRGLGVVSSWGGAVGIAALLSGCSAGGSGVGSSSTSSSNRPSGQPVIVPAADAPPPVLDAPGEPTTVDFIGDEVVPTGDRATSSPVRRRGLVQKQVTCPDGGTTSVSGTVYIPSGQLPLYNAMIYVPDADLRPFTPGASCTCEINGAPIATALSDSKGHFVLENVPVGDNIPLVVQVGDWRREFNIGTVAACTDNPVVDRTLRLPSRQSQGDIPRIAVATGRLDALECLVRKLGVDESEFTGEGGGGRVTLFAGEGGSARYANRGEAFPPAPALWNDLESLSRYDVVLMSCDGERDNLANKSERSFQAMYDYLNQGGRVFGSHYQDVWLEHGPAPLQSLAEFKNQTDLGTVSAQVVTTFPKGQALSEWLSNTGASSSAGQVEIRGAQHNIVSEDPAYAQRWISTAAPKESVQYISANTPIGASDSEQCGRLVLSDIHVSPGKQGDDLSDPDPKYDFPQGCVTSTLSPQEAVLAFMLFDLSACIVPDDQAPVAPPTILR
jgi:hypothetical protein